jgi:hypothetical protein
MLKQLSDKNSIQQCRLTLQESIKRMSFLQQELDKLTLSSPETFERKDKGKKSPFFMKKNSPVKSPKLLPRKGLSEPNLDTPGNTPFQSMTAPNEEPTAYANPASSSTSVFSALLSTFGKKSQSERSLNTVTGMGGGSALTLDTSDHIPTGIGEFLFPPLSLVKYVKV